jgi:hypothetical protein
MNGDGVIVRTGRDAIHTGAYIGKAATDGQHIVQLEDGRIDNFSDNQLTPLARTFTFNAGAMLVIEGEDGGHFLHYVPDAVAEAQYRSFWDGKFGKKIVAKHDLSLQPLRIREQVPGT